MKKYISFVILVLPIMLFSQEGVPPVLNGLTPKWYHVLKDTNYVQDTFGLNIRSAYNICFPRRLKLADHQLLINNTCTSGLGDYHGNIIQDIDTRSGKMKWVRALNNDNYLDHQEYFPGMFFDQEQNKVILTGFQKYGTPSTYSPGWFAPQPVLFSTIKLDGDKGDILKHVVNSDLSDTIRLKPNVGIFMRTNEHNDWYLRGLPIDLGCLHTFERITEEQKLVSDSSLTYFSPKIGQNPVYFLGENLIEQDNHNNMYGIVMNKNFFYPQPLNAKIIKFHLNDETEITQSSINVEFETDISDFIRLPETEIGFLPNALVTDEALYLTMSYLDTLNNYSLKSWLLGIGADGNVLFYVNSLEVVGTAATSLRFIGRKNGRLFYNLSNKQNDRTIYSIDDQGIIETYGIIHNRAQSPKIEFSNAVISDENDLIISMKIDNEYWYTAAYDPKDFGIDIFSSTFDVGRHHSYKVYPNPTSSTITIQADYDIHGNWCLYDALDRVIKTSQTQGLHTNLDLSDLTSGVYFLRLQQQGQAEIQIEKIIKL
ncbi:MAG: T9SS type A sorting domain-containing protein [Lewinellaceae bacterium]|nr:T9SS type A sorting domain-containing protein [Lewinellaceae bacterium]